MQQTENIPNSTFSSTSYLSPSMKQYKKQKKTHPLMHQSESALLSHDTLLQLTKYQTAGRWKDFLIMDIMQAYRNAIRNIPQYILGCGSVFIVVVIVSVLLTAISYAPLVFLSLAEGNAGEIDIQIVPANWAPYSRINYTLLTLVLGDLSRNTVPRVSNIGANAYDTSQCTGFDILSPNNNTFSYSGPPILSSDDSDTANLKQSLQSLCATHPSGISCAATVCQQSTSINVYFVNSPREQQLGIGRAWPYPPVPSGSCYMHEAVARTMKVQEGSYILIPIDISDAFPVLYQRTINETLTDLQNYRWVNVILRVDTIISGNFGKLPTSDNTVIYIEWNETMSILSSQISPLIANSTVLSDFRSIAAEPGIMDEGVTDVILNCADDRLSCYMTTSYNSIAQLIIDEASQIVFNLDFTIIDSWLPVLSQLSGTQVVSAFLNLIFSLVIIMMSGLSVFLIYSLLMVSVETRTFELGVFRMVGMTRSGLVLLILVQALMYAIPGWVFGLIVGEAAWLGLRGFLENLLNSNVGRQLSPNSVGICTILGILVPLISSILPIKEALSNNLHDSLDTRRSKTKAFILTIERTRGQTFSPALFSIGLLMAVAGFLIYYLFPMALLFNNVTLLFNIFLALLIGMMLGLTLLALNLQPLVERFLVWFFFSTFFFMEKKSIPKLVVKNLIAHRLRNRKTSIMYALALGFIIFLTVSVKIQLQSLVYNSSRSLGGDIAIQSTSLYGLLPFIYEDYCNFSPYVKDYSYITFAQRSINTSLTSYDIMNIGRTTTFESFISGVAPNFYTVPPPQYTVVTDTLYPSAESASASLYYPDSLYRADMGSLFQSTLDLDSFDTEFVYRTGVSLQFQTLYDIYPMRPSSFMNSAPILQFSAYPSVPDQDMAVSYLTLMAIFNGSIPSIEMLPLWQMSIELVDDISDSDLNTVIADLTAQSGPYITIQNLKFQLSGIETAQNTLGWIFQLVTLAAMVVTFFSLNSSMFTNIMEQKMEIGVLRAVGLNKPTIFRLFAYEAFFLVMAASVLGTMIGVVAGWTMAAQRSAVTEIPLFFVFPWDIFLLVMGIGVVCAILATVGPISKLVYSLPVISLLRG